MNSEINAAILALLKKDNLPSFRICQILSKYDAKKVRNAIHSLAFMELIVIAGDTRNEKRREVYLWGIAPEQPEIKDPPGWLYPHVRPFQAEQIIRHREVCCE